MLMRMCSGLNALADGHDTWPAGGRQLLADGHDTWPAGGRQLLADEHDEELVQTREVFDLVFALVIGHTAAKYAPRQVGHQLHKNELALVQNGLGRKPVKNRQSDAPRRSNRDQPKTLNSTIKSLTYDVLMVTRCDTTAAP